MAETRQTYIRPDALMRADYFPGSEQGSQTLESLGQTFREAFYGHIAVGLVDVYSPTTRQLFEDAVEAGVVRPGDRMCLFDIDGRRPQGADFVFGDLFDPSNRYQVGHTIQEADFLWGSSVIDALLLPAERPQHVGAFQKLAPVAASFVLLAQGERPEEVITLSSIRGAAATRPGRAYFTTRQGSRMALPLL